MFIIGEVQSQVTQLTSFGLGGQTWENRAADTSYGRGDWFLGRMRASHQNPTVVVINSQKLKCSREKEIKNERPTRQPLENERHVQEQTLKVDYENRGSNDA